MTRQSDTLEARRAADDWASEHGLPPSGGYSGSWYRDGYLAGWWPDWASWWANYSEAAGALLGGQIVAHQWTSTPVDQSVMVESEIVQVGGDVKIPTEYVTKFHLANDQDVNGLIANFEGVITTVRQIALAEGQAAGADAEAKLQRIKDVVNA